jgi:hypothetical protein
MNNRYPIEFIKHLTESAFKSMGLGESVINVQISEEVETDDASGTELKHLTAKCGFIEFELHEVMVYRSPNIVGYQPVWPREIPGRGMNPPEDRTTHGGIWGPPSKAIKQGIVHCVEESIEDACTDQQAYNDWKEEQEASNES